jgi:hypothetical protein
MVATAGVNGSNSYITLPSAQTFTAIGGGGGNSRNKTTTAATGGSGGGGGYGNGTPTSGGSGTGTGVTLQGYSGGRIQTGNSGGGGGGAGAIGFNWIDSDSNAGSGGSGLQYSISGSATYYAGGGGGGAWAAMGGAGGSGGGGAGGSVDSSNCRANCASGNYVAQTGNVGTSNTGGGGGSGNAGSGAPAGKGGSGVVIIRYALNLTSTFNSLTLPGGVNIATFRTPVSVTANVSVASKISFYVNGKVLPGCKNRLTSGSGSSHSVTCNWKPSLRGNFYVSAISTPTSASTTGASAIPVLVNIASRSIKR